MFRNEMAREIRAKRLRFVKLMFGNAQISSGALV